MRKMISTFDMFSIGIGPSSSHTLGPMRAASKFVLEIKAKSLLEKVNSITVELYGSLAYTGEGHGTDRAITLGFESHDPETSEPDFLFARFAEIENTKLLLLDNKFPIAFDPKKIVHDYDRQLPYHPNAMFFCAYDEHHNCLYSKTYYSVGGGAVVEHEAGPSITSSDVKLPYQFSTTKELLQLCRENNLRIYELMQENEKCWRKEETIRNRLLKLVDIMQKSIERGLRCGGVLPGGLNVTRRAPILYSRLIRQKKSDPDISCCVGADVSCYVAAWALAVAEENAAGGRVVVAPTNGSAGVLPAVLWYCKKFCFEMDDEKTIEYLLTAAAIEVLYKKQASISGAEVGCQGEIGVACSMAAGALTAVLGGDLDQIENAAEIGIEHHLGLTCDPMRGLVQIPCIERNVVAANQAINIAHLVLAETGKHIVSLDKAIQTMKQTGFDMSLKYKETALGGLAVNIPNC